MAERDLVTIHILPSARPVSAEAGETLLSALRRAGVSIDASCGGSGTCGKCAVVIVDGSHEETVLACRFRIDRDMAVRMPEAAVGGDKIWAREGARDEGFGFGESGAAAATRADARDGSSISSTSGSSCPAATRADARDESLDFGARDEAMRERPETVRSRHKTHAGAAFDAHAQTLAGGPQATYPAAPTRGAQILAGARTTGSSVPTAKRPYAGGPATDLRLAFDIGTTTIAGYLLDAGSGAALAALSAPNPQRAYGADVISRCAYAAEHGASTLTQSVRGALNELTQELCRSAGAEPDQISAACAVGNTCMHHLFLGLSPAPLAAAPYRPAVTGPFVLDAALFGLTLGRGARLIVPPVIAGFVGSDTVGCLVASDFDRFDGAAFIVDVGTNGELALSANGRRAACSAAAGPAFEGANIRCGMRATCGAIREVTIADGDIAVSTVGGERSVGICGSGLIDAIACMLDLGVLDASGRILPAAALPDTVPPAVAKRLVERDGKPAFLLAETGADGVYVGQADVRELQLAKAAIAAGIALLIKHLCVSTDQIRRVLLAGAFGNALSPKSAARVGLIPRELLDRAEPVGNAAGVGACQIALDQRAFLRAAQLARTTEHLELSGHPAFEDTFVDSLAFPEGGAV